jgi:hypothetical protein
MSRRRREYNLRRYERSSKGKQAMHAKPNDSRSAATIAIAAFFCLAAADAPGHAQQSATQPAAAAAAGAAIGTPVAEPPRAIDPEVDHILTRLENREIHDLRARVTWELSYPIEEDTDVKSGEIWYKQLDPVARFKVHFRQKVTAGRKLPLDEQHLFDGRWYIELNAQTKTVTRREVRAEDDRRNPYKLGEGAFPIPFGQKKEDILREFEVVRQAPVADRDPPETDHLLLVPRPGTSTESTYVRLDFWIAREGRLAGLPVKVMAGKKDGSGKLNSNITVTFDDVKLNDGFSASVFELPTPPGFEEIIERLEPPPAPPPTP